MTLREQKKLRTRTNVLRVAHALFHAKGFDSTTLEEICREAEISKRTFFRYFQDKEALVFPNRDDRLAGFQTFLRAHDTESPFDTLRRATRLFGLDYSDNRRQILTQKRLILSSPALLAREREIDRDWEREIARIFLERAPDGPEWVLWSRVTAGAIMGVVRATMDVWFENDCNDDLVVLGLSAIDNLERGFPVRD